MLFWISIVLALLGVASYLLGYTKKRIMAVSGVLIFLASFLAPELECLKNELAVFWIFRFCGVCAFFYGLSSPNEKNQ